MNIKTSVELADMVWDKTKPIDEVVNSKWVAVDDEIAFLKDLSAELAQPEDKRVQAIFKIEFRLKQLQSEKE